MKVCFPTEKLQGMESMLYGHFGSAPSFVIVDMQTAQLDEIHNADQHHTHRQALPRRPCDGHHRSPAGGVC